MARKYQQEATSDLTTPPEDNQMPRSGIIA